jgi:hypothetical protein
MGCKALEEAYAAGAFQIVGVYGRRCVRKPMFLRKFAADRPDVRFFQVRKARVAKIWLFKTFCG